MASDAFNEIIKRYKEFVKPQNSGDDKGAMKADRSTYMTARELLLQAMSDEELKKSEVYPNQCFAKQSYLFCSLFSLIFSLETTIFEKREEQKREK